MKQHQVGASPGASRLEHAEPEPPRCAGVPEVDWTHLHAAIRWVEIGWWDAGGIRTKLIHNPRLDPPRVAPGATPGAQDHEREGVMPSDPTNATPGTHAHAGVTHPAENTLGDASPGASPAP